MNTTSEDAFVHAHDASLRAYERGRLRMAAVHAVTFALVSAGLSLTFVEARSLVWLPLTLVAWGLLEWRGVGLLRGGRVGAIAGAVTLALPLSLLRRCCKPGALEMMGADCCSMPGACAAAGVVVGLVLACALPVLGTRMTGVGPKPREVVLGMVIGIGAVAPLKCSVLLVGEAAGLVGGLLAGVLAASAVQLALGRWTVRLTARL
jgi:hypothetical protein